MKRIAVAAWLTGAAILATWWLVISRRVDPALIALEHAQTPVAQAGSTEIDAVGEADAVVEQTPEPQASADITRMEVEIRLLTTPVALVGALLLLSGLIVWLGAPIIAPCIPGVEPDLQQVLATLFLSTAIASAGAVISLIGFVSGHHVRRAANLGLPSPLKNKNRHPELWFWWNLAGVTLTLAGIALGAVVSAVSIAI